MKRPWKFSVLLVGLCALPTRGADLPADAIRVSYVSRVPQQVLAHRPKSALTRFYGVSEIGQQKLALHFYALQPLRKNPQTRTVKRDSRLDVFVQCSERRGVRFHKLSSTPITVQTYTEDKPRFSLAMLWLDPATKKQPIFIVRQFQGNLGGYQAPNLFFTFAQGIEKRPAVTQFLTYWSESLSEGGVFFGPTDENGHLTVVDTDRYGNSIDLTAYKWNGKNFAEFQKANNDPTSPIGYSWDGKKFLKVDAREQAPRQQSIDEKKPESP